jgi:hypothetical protein
MQKVHCHFIKKLQLIISIEFQNYFKLESSISPFLYSTCPLSVINYFIGFEGGPPIFKKDYTYLFLLIKKNYYFMK